MEILLKIERVLPLASGGAVLELAGATGAAVQVDAAWLKSWAPVAGGYINPETEGYLAPSALVTLGA